MLLRLITVFLVLSGSSAFSEPLEVGSKIFTESYVLGELATMKLNRDGHQATFRKGMGGTIILWQAIKSGEIDFYPEYTGTISEQILKSKTSLTLSEMKGIGMTDPLGFNNTYAISLKREKAESLGVKKISDLKNHPDLKGGMTPEFLNRRDGWYAMANHYGLRMQNIRGIEHALAYIALDQDSLDLTDAYSTDAKIEEMDLITLEDDLKFFPEYNAVFLYRLDLSKDVIKSISQLSGTINEKKMIQMNASAEATNDYKKAAALYFGLENVESEPVYMRVLKNTVRHLGLVFYSLLFAILIGVPLGIIASKGGLIGQGILGVVGVIQTIPSLALLAILVATPFLYTDGLTAIIALFLYSLLPIVRNTTTGLQNIAKTLKESAEAMGLEKAARMRFIYLPIASRTILAGIKTSAIINIGTATLAALIGAGGLGEDIISGLALNDARTILLGAIPAAGLAIAASIFFEGVDRILIPKGLRLKEET